MKKTLLVIAALAMALGVSAQTLTISDFTIKAGETKAITLDLTNSMEITAFQCDVMFPEGITIVQEDGEYVIDLERTTYKKHTLEAAEQKDGGIRFLCYSTGVKTFSDNSGAVVDIDIKAAENITSGEAKIKLYNVEITEPNGTKHNPADAETKVTITSATGINNISLDDVANAQYFSANGIQTNGAQKGLNIIKTKNGVVKVVK